MDPFSEHAFLGDIFWSQTGFDQPPPNNNPPSFLPYTPHQISVNINSNHTSLNNINNRMIEFARRSCPIRTEIQESESDRSHRRKMCERFRREKEKKEFLALHSMLPPGTKNDKNSIMQTTAMTIQELNNYKEALQRRNYELEVELGAAAAGLGNLKTSKIKLKVVNPLASGVDYIMEILKCLNSLGSKIITIQSTFSGQQLEALMEIETQLSDAELREEVQRSLQEVERKSLFDFPEEA